MELKRVEKGKEATFQAEHLEMGRAHLTSITCCCETTSIATHTHSRSGEIRSVSKEQLAKSVYANERQECPDASFSCNRSCGHLVQSLQRLSAALGHAKVANRSKKKEKKNYVDRGNSPYINKGIADTLGQKRLESPPPQFWLKSNALLKQLLRGLWKEGGAPRPVHMVLIRVAWEMLCGWHTQLKGETDMLVLRHATGALLGQRHQQKPDNSVPHIKAQGKMRDTEGRPNLHTYINVSGHEFNNCTRRRQKA
eukprot:1158418-Pelagomonas_calceolata.AAC.7